MLRTLCIVLIVSILFNSIGVMLIFQVQRSVVRREMKLRLKEGVPANELHDFIFKKDEYLELEWIKPEREFRLGDRLFDVVRKETQEDGIHLQCINDVEEQRLFTSLDQLTDRKCSDQRRRFGDPLTQLVRHLKNMTHPGFLSNKEMNAEELSISPKYVGTCYTPPFLKGDIQPPEHV